MLDRLKELYGDAFRILSGSKGVDAPEWNGKYDPLGGAAICTPEGRGPYELGADGKIYAPLVSGGYDRSLILIPKGEAVRITTNDTPIVLIDATTYPMGGYLVSAYQNSGGPLNLSVLSPATGETMDIQAINSATTTIYQNNTWHLPPGTRLKWSAAAGALQYVVVIPIRAVNTAGDTVL